MPWLVWVVLLVLLWPTVSRPQDYTRSERLTLWAIAAVVVLVF